MCNNNSDCNCISEILTVINILQNNAECPDTCLDSCDRGFLGGSISSVSLNTRPIMLYTCNSNGLTPWTMPTTKEAVSCEGDGCSSVFRVEKIDGCCATFRVLSGSDGNYSSTNSFFTMDLSHVCCVRCLQDTFVEGV